ncbi:hypothetical protein PV-S19_0091 [Pacmanvirus S19]|nr:hypothetical protein PV-S19_0091 [Pacmanvirus S19]
MESYLIAIIIVVIIFILYNIVTWNVNSYEDYIYGFWVAEDDEFCEDSEIDSMLLFIGKHEDSWCSRQRTCYLIIMNNICAQGLKIDYKTGWSGIGIGKYKIKCGVEFDDEQIWDENVEIIVDMLSGTMKIIGYDGTLYAKLNKQHDVSNLAEVMEDSAMVDE